MDNIYSYSILNLDHQSTAWKNLRMVCTCMHMELLLGMLANILGGITVQYMKVFIYLLKFCMSIVQILFVFRQVLRLAQMCKGS